jgi:AraC family transcriptional regulator
MQATRRAIVDTPLLLAETGSLPAHRGRRGFSPDSQVAFFLHGVLRWKTGRQQAVVDANAALLVHGGEEFSEEHPVAGVGHASLIVTPGSALMDELFRGRRPTGLTRPVSPKTMLGLHTAIADSCADPQSREEQVLRLLIDVAETSTQAGAAHTRRVERAKQLLHASDHRWSLAAIAREVGVSPTYLTQQFSRSEGMPFHRYQSRLRLARALAELPRCSDLTRLALDLGFSSHSHFAASFRAMVGVSPSRFRRTCAG